jgi:hypothetical protein
MQNPTDQAETEASVPTETTVYSNGTHWDRTVNVRRTAAKRTNPFHLTAEELLIVPSSSSSSSSSPPQDEDIPARKKQRLEEPFPKTADLRKSTRLLGKKLPRYFASLPPPPQDEDIPARKKPRLEEPFPTTRARTRSTTTNEAAGTTSSPDISVDLPLPVTDDDDDDANADSVTDTQSNAGATGCWTLAEDAKLTCAMKNTCKKKHGSEYKTDWVSVAALVPGRTRGRCRSRWHDALDPSIGRANGRTGKWTGDEDSKLKDAVQTHGGKDWAAIAALVPGRTRGQCCHRWHNVLDRSTDPAMARAGKWTEDEDSKLNDAVQMHGSKNWVTVAALVPGRTNIQCGDRWHHALDRSTDPAMARAGKWTAVEDRKVKGAVQTHGGKDWAAIAALVPGRTKQQCRDRWKKHMDPNRSTVRGKGQGTLKNAPALG